MKATYKSCAIEAAKKVGKTPKDGDIFLIDYLFRSNPGREYMVGPFKMTMEEVKKEVAKLNAAARVADPALNRWGHDYPHSYIIYEEPVPQVGDFILWSSRGEARIGKALKVTPIRDRALPKVRVSWVFSSYRGTIRHEEESTIKNNYRRISPAMINLLNV